MNEKEDLDHTLEHALEGSEHTLPEDKYFKKIWNSIETHAPVGEKYYLRWVFAAFFIILFIGVVGLFYSDFLSSVLTLKEIRRENAAFLSSSLTGPASYYGAGPRDVKQRQLLPGLTITTVDKEWMKVKNNGPDSVEIDFYRGHVLIEKAPQVPPVIIHFPDLKLTLHGGKLNLFCYDRIIRIIPIADPVEIEYKDTRHRVLPGKEFYLLNGKETWR